MYNTLPSFSRAEERARKLALLSKTEKRAFGYLFKGFSEAWTTETLGMETRDAKKLYAGMYKKLGVRTPRELILSYAPHDIDTKDSEEKNLLAEYKKVFLQGESC